MGFMTDWNEGSCRAGWPQTYNLMVYIPHRLYGWDWTVVLLD